MNTVLDAPWLISLSQIAGQRRLVEYLRLAIDAAFAGDKTLGGTLLVGGSGVGKTAIAKVIAKELAADDLIESCGPLIRTPKLLNEVLSLPSDGDVLHIEAADRIPKSVQAAFCCALDRECVVHHLMRPDVRMPRVQLGIFTLLLSTDHEAGLIPALRQRLVILRFDPYTEDDLVQILRHRCRAYDWHLDDEVLPAIAQRSRGTPRSAIQLLMATVRISMAVGEDRLTLGQLKKLCELEGIDDLGFDLQEQAYLRALLDGPVGLRALSSILALDPRTITEIIEPPLIRLALVKIQGGRRRLTEQGRGHLSGGQPLPLRATPYEQPG